MEFRVIAIDERTPTDGVSQAFLQSDRWDDWGKYRTQFYLIVFDEHGQKHEPGNVKIGQFRLQPNRTVEPGKRAPAVQPQFESLGQEFFSLGQSETYYETLNGLSPEMRLTILRGLRDAAFDLTLFAQAGNEDVMSESLLRSLRAEQVRNRLHRLAMGDATLTPFRFRYTLPDPPIEIEGYDSPSLEFYVTPNSLPPTNIHVLIGRNGVGKSRCMQHLAKTVLGVPDAGSIEPIVAPRQPFVFLSVNEEPWSFSGLISVSFSAFDDFDLPRPMIPGIRADSIGLRTLRPLDDDLEEGNLDAAAVTEERPDNVETVLKTPPELNQDFADSFGRCRTGPRRDRWYQAVETLCNDPLFAEANPLGLLDEVDQWEGYAFNFFDRLSSGHKIVLLTITRLVELVDERTLVLLDEPEGHLHPPLLSAFVRSLSDLLIKRNGVAIIATHSPVVLQEVPRSCALMLRRAGYQAAMERPNIETFGENVGVLTHEVFGLEVTTAGFHDLLSKAINGDNLSYQQLLEAYNNQLGSEGKAIAQAMLSERERGTNA